MRLFYLPFGRSELEEANEQQSKAQITIEQLRAQVSDLQTTQQVWLKKRPNENTVHFTKVIIGVEERKREAGDYFGWTSKRNEVKPGLYIFEKIGIVVWHLAQH